MNELLSRLTPAHFLRGWPVYWRIYLPFWIHLIYILGVLALSLFLHGTNLILFIQNWLPEIVDWPYLVNIFVGVGIYFAGRPLVKRGQKKVSMAFESDFYKRQYSIFGVLYKFNKGMISLIILFLFFFIE